MTTRNLSRRAALKALALSSLGIPAMVGNNARAQTVKTGKSAEVGHQLRLGLATFSLRHLAVDDVIPVMKDLRLENAGPFRSHIPWSGSADECRVVADKFHAAGIVLSGSGVFRLPNDRAALLTAFQNARAAGLRTMVCSPEPAALPLVEEFAVEFNQRLAIHNHGPEDSVFPTPREIWAAIQPLDKRIGVCLDIVHGARAGADPIDMIRLCAPRLYDFHLRDTIGPVGAMKDIPVEVGAGRLDIIGILSTLIDIRYDGVVALEYEKEGNVLAGVAESIGYTRGVLATLERA